MNVYADLSHLGAIRQFVTLTGHELDLDEQTISDLQLAAEEICANAISHGYGGRGGEIEVTVERIAEGIQMTVRDWGNSFDPETVPVPDLSAPLEERPLGGLGLYLVRQLMDEVHFELGGVNGNLVTMIKRLGPNGGE
jgi:serine/threonine-protein kinase RsbW